MSTIVHEQLAVTDIEYKNKRFLITHSPIDSTIGKYIEDLKKRQVRELVRACDLTYSEGLLESEGIRVVDMSYRDGSPPPNTVVHDWLELLVSRFKETPDGCVAVHCVSGLGRAPVLVAIALMEMGMRYEDAVQFIRERRRGAINTKQLEFLARYKAKSRLKPSHASEPCRTMCSLM